MVSKTCGGDRNNGLKGEYCHAILPMREGKLSFSNLVHFPFPYYFHSTDEAFYVLGKY